MFPFTQLAKQKGWKMQDLAFYWGVTPRQLSRIAKDPKQIHIDALRGLPEFSDKYLTRSIV